MRTQGQDQNERQEDVTNHEGPAMRLRRKRDSVTEGSLETSTNHTARNATAVRRRPGRVREQELATTTTSGTGTGQGGHSRSPTLHVIKVLAREPLKLQRPERTGGNCEKTTGQDKRVPCNAPWVAFLSSTQLIIGRDCSMARCLKTA